MHDLLRLFAIAALSFTVVGVALVYSGGDVISGMPPPVVQSVTALSAPTPEPAGKAPPAPAKNSVLMVQRPDPTVWVGLASLPDAIEVAFPLPRQQGYRSGALVLLFASHLAEEGEALLTLSVNGTPREQIVVQEGESSHAVRVALAPADLVEDEVVLHMAARGGTSGDRTCTVDAASVITLRPESGLELELVDAQARSSMAVQAATRPLALTVGSGETDAALSIWSAQRLDRAGFDLRLGSADGPELPVVLGTPAVPTDSLVLGSGEDVAQLVDLVGYEDPPPVRWPVSLAAIDAEIGVKNFRRFRQWAIQFAAADLPGGQLPQALALKLAAVQLPEGGEWALRVVLNDNLIQSHRFPGDAELISVDVALPAERLLPSNVLEIQLVDAAPRLSQCGEPEQVSAQLLPESALIDPASTTQDWPGLIQQLAGVPTLSLTSPADLTLQQATQASGMLGLILGRDPVPELDAEGAAQIAVATRDTLPPAILRLGDQVVSVVLPTHAAHGASIRVLTLPNAELSTALNRLEVDDVILLVTGL